MSNALRIFRRKHRPDLCRSLQQTLSAFAGCVLTLLCLSSCGCMEPAVAADQPVRAQKASPVAADVLVATERLKFEQDSQPVLPDDLGGNKQYALPGPPVITPEVNHPPYVPGPNPSPLPDTRPVMRVYKPDFACPPCIRMDGDKDLLPVRCVFEAAPQWVNDWVAQDGRRGYPVLHFEYRGRWWTVCGYNGPDRFRQWWASVQAAESMARPREPWRNLLPRNTPADVSTDTEEAISLPTTRINLAGQAIEFIDSRESRLNRWFSVAFRQGSIKHSGNSVAFSAPPEMRLHFTEGGAGMLLDSLKSIEFTATGANLHLGRIGTIPFRVRGK